MNGNGMNDGWERHAGGGNDVVLRMLWWHMPLQGRVANRARGNEHQFEDRGWHDSVLQSPSYDRPRKQTLGRGHM